MEDTHKITPPVNKKRRLSEVERLAKQPDPADLQKCRRKRKEMGRIPQALLTPSEGLPVPNNNLSERSVEDDTYLHMLADNGYSTDEDINEEEVEEDNYYEHEVSEEDNELAEDGDDNEEEDNKEMPLSVPTPSANRLVKFDLLKEMVESRCKCAQCQGAVNLSEITIGIATTVILTCNSCSIEDQRSEAGMESFNGTKIVYHTESALVTRASGSQKTFRDFPIHYSLVLLMQQLGCGLEGIRAVLSHLNLCPTVGNWIKWREIIDTIGCAQQEIADKCMVDNMKEEITLSKEAGLPTVVDPHGRKRQAVAASVDMGWQKRSSGHRYDSPSGVSLMIGAESKKIVQRHVCSKLCRVCDEAKRLSKKTTKPSETPKDLSIRPHRCSKNYEGSSKGMEAQAAVICVKNFYVASATTNGCEAAFIDVTISDDDSSTWANLQQSLTMLLEQRNKDLISQGLPAETKKEWVDWPKTKRGVPKKDYGQFTLDELPSRQNLADPNHRAKVLGKHLYPLTSVPVSSGKQITKATAERFKVNFNRAIHQYRGKSDTEMRNGLLATLEHEFGNHEHCSNDWCKFLNAKTSGEREQLQSRWWSKNDSATLYAALNRVYMDFLTPERIRQMNHKHDTQKNESMNKKIARVCPKSTTFSKSMVLSDRVAWVVMEDSLGGCVAVEELFNRLGITPLPPTLKDYYTKNDKTRARHHEYTLQKSVKQRRRLNLNTKIWQDRVQATKDREQGKDYSSGMAFEETTAQEKTTKTASTEKKLCTACGGNTHQRRSHKMCPMNKFNWVGPGKDILCEEVKQNSQIEATTTTTTTIPDGKMS